MSADGKLGIALWEADRHPAALSEALAEWTGLPACITELELSCAKRFGSVAHARPVNSKVAYQPMFYCSVNTEFGIYF